MDRLNPKEDTKRIFHEYTGPLVRFALFGFILLVGLLINEFVCGGIPANYYLRMVLLVIAGAAFVFGLLIGFVLAPYGDEKQTFGPIAALINGVLGGFALSDLSKKDSAIRQGFHCLASAAGLPGVGLVGTIVGFFGTIGFLCGYLNKQYIVNVSLTQAKEFEGQALKISEITKGISLSLGDAERKPKLSDEDRKKLEPVLESFSQLTTDESLFRELSIDTIRSYAKAYFLLEEWEKSEKVLRKARQLVPDDPDVLFLLANVLCKTGRYEDAIAYLSFLEKIPATRVSTYKLLGYAYLFVPGKLAEAEEASKKYLAIHPKDAGAELNLACVYGQRGPADQTNRAEALRWLGRAIQDNAEAKPLVRPLRMGDGDFSKWNEVPDFLALFGPLLIELNEPSEVQYWCREFGCTEDKLRATVAVVGTDAAAVRKALGDPGAAH